MAGSVGYAVLPTTISLSGINKELQDKLLAPTEKAAKKAGDSIEKGITKGADDAAKRVEKANYRVEKSTQELADAESKRNAEVLKSQAAAKQLEAAESKLADMKKSGTASSEQLAKAEADVLNKRARAETAAQNVEKAERGVEKAITESKRASDSLAAAQKELETATDGATDATTKFGDAAADADGKGQRFELSLGKIAAAGAVVVGAIGAAGKAAYEIGASFDDAYDTIRVGTGASGEAFAELQESMRNVARDSIGVGSDMGAIGTTLADLNTRLGLTGEPLEKMTAQFMQLQNLGVDADINEVSKAMSGFGIEAKDMPDALDELFQVSQATGLSITELSQSAVKAGPALRGFGFSMSDSAALVGQMDKAGLDADKTLQSLQRALAEFASEGRDAPEALKETIGSIEELISAGDDAAAIDMASNIFGTRGAAQFVDAVKTGTLSVDDFMDATGATSDTIGGLAEETADFAERWDQFKLQAMVAIEPIASQVFDLLVPALEKAGGVIETVAGKLQVMGEWVQKNADWLAPLAVAVGTFATYVVTASAALEGVNKAVELATGGFKAFSLALSVNPIVLVLGAITALVGGLIYFFTQTETGREMWANFTQSLGDAWQNFQDRFVAVVETVQQWWTLGVAMINVAADSMRAKIAEVIGGIVVKFYEWQNTTAAVIEAIKGFFQGFADKVRETSSQALTYVGELPGRIKGMFSDAGTWLVNAGKNIISGLINGIKSMFGQVGDAIREVMPDSVERFVPGLSTGGQIPGYSTGGYIHAIPGIPDSQRDPILGVDSAGIPVARIEPKEYVVNRDATRKNLPLLQDINSGKLSMKDLPGYANGGLVSSQDVLDFVWGRNVNGKQAPFPLEGAKYTWGGGLLGNWGDCSGAMSGIAAFIIGMNLNGRKFATGNQDQVLTQMGFNRGTSPGRSAFEVGFFTGGPYGGHTSGSIFDANGRATNVEMGGGRGNGQIGGRAAGSRHPQYPNRFWIGLQDKPIEPPKMNEILPMDASGKIDTTLTAPASSSGSTSTQTVALTPREAAIATAANELGNQSVVEHLTAGLLDMAGLSGGVLEKALLGDPSSWLPSGDSIITSKDVQVSTSSAKEQPKVPVDKTQAPPVISPAEERERRGPDWGPEFFAGEIARKAKDMGLDRLAAKIGLATALVESGNPLKMYANRAVPESLSFRHDAIGSDYDSVGLFQQRDNGAWGTVKQRMTPYDSAGMFFTKLKGFDYRSMDPGAAAQKVQVSAFPGRYAQQMAAAEKLLSTVGVFDKGGLAYGKGFLPKNVIKPERVLSPEMTPLFDRFIGFLPRFMDTVDTARAELRVAAAGGDAGYGALAELFGDRVAYRLADGAFWAGGLVSELEQAFKGGDFGYASAAHLFGEEAGRALVDEAGWLGTAFEEVSAAWQGGDFGMGATARYLGGNEWLAGKLLDAVTSVGEFAATVDTAREEIGAAFDGEDFGSGAVEQLFGAHSGRALLDEADWLGAARDEFRAAAVGEDFGSGATERYLGSRGAAAALNAAGSRQRVEQVVQFNVDPDSLVRVGDIADMIDQRIDGARAEFVNRRPAMAVTTRGKVF